MKKVRRIKKVLKSKPTLEGAGVHLKRAFGNQQVPCLIPFCFSMIFIPIIPILPPGFSMASPSRH